jgi:hypothetical protein
MSQKAHRIVAGIFLIAILVLAMPVPSHAAGFRVSSQSVGWTMRLWNWLESFVLGTKASPTVSLWEQEGSAIDPNGHS